MESHYVMIILTCPICTYLNS